jgi:toxin CcdB
MARLDVYPAPGRDAVGYVVDVQSDTLTDLATRVVVPLLPEATARVPIGRLNPVFEINGERCVLIVQAIATVPRQVLRGAVASLKDQRDPVLTVIDFLLPGF